MKSMAKDLFVRGFDEKLHAKATQIATNDRVTLGSIVTDAIDKWVKNYEKNRHRHNLILYSDQISLKKILDEINNLASDNWLKSYCGPAEHSGIKILDKRKWFDATGNKYEDFLEKPQETGIKVIETINSKVKEAASSKGNSNLLPMTVTFLVEDLARKESVKEAAGVCKWYESKSLPGVTYCIANAKNVLAASFDELFELFNAHNGVFLIKNNKIYRLRIDDEHFYSLLI
ncbi:MAG TPA: hypothetical protein VH415_03775 [Nitrososphaeraceae archaeon]|jgi:hypothetical protein